MELLQPIFLWGMLGLSIPLLIHLWNGRQGKTLAWAASQWLPTSKTQPVQSIRLDHWLLLFLRMLLILLIVMLLSQVFIKSWGNEKSGISFEGKINRKDWGLNWNTALETGGVLVSDEVKLYGELQFVKQS